MREQSERRAQRSNQMSAVKKVSAKLENKMGLLMSFMGKGGSPSSQMLSIVMGTLYNQFVEKDINDFDSFHIAVLDIFNTINMALPGKHYDAPSHKEVEDLFQNWKAETKEDKRKKIFTEFMQKNVNLRKIDDSMMITGIVAPPAAMVVKRGGETLPQLKVVKAIPDVVFVPTATVLALISVKVSRKIFMKKVHGSETLNA
ncbi:hypothetical protein L6164_006950 [Bauhinia variegata]|uniref:Uncharacterized protein n=1 Tax=Bauhinia variegata TaxID=167791 RepID=A0ACB9PXV6_BAUVA|nr:hypothetical protein L6164_006950 [Bauhinia variegata]